VCAGGPLLEPVKLCHSNFTTLVIFVNIQLDLYLTVIFVGQLQAGILQRAHHHSAIHRRATDFVVA